MEVEMQVAVAVAVVVGGGTLEIWEVLQCREALTGAMEPRHSLLDERLVLIVDIILNYSKKIILIIIVPTNEIHVTYIN